MPTQVRRASLVDQAAGLLLARIRSGEWELGARLPGESTLAVQLGVGRSTLREAVGQLAGRGVLTARQGSGVFVTALDIPENWDEVLRRVDIAAILEARTAIEVEAASLAAQRRTPAHLRAMRATLAVRDRLRGEAEAHVAADIDFHRSVVAAAGNPVLIELFDSMTPRVRTAMIDFLRLRRDVAADADDADQRAHADIVDAIAERSVVDAARCARAHLDGLKGALA